MTVRIYRNTDAGAPVLNGTTGSLFTLLSTCLVGTGGVAYGSIPSMGWTKLFAGTTSGYFKQAAGNGFSVWIDDTANRGSNFATMIGYEQPISSTVANGRFPVDGQQAGGLWMHKSTTTDTVARPWILIATEKQFYFISNGNQPTNYQNDVMGSWGAYFFGDLISYLPNDLSATLIIGNVSNTSNGSNIPGGITSLGTSSTGCFLARSFNQIPGSITCGKLTEAVKMQTGTFIGVVDGTYQLANRAISENTAVVVRGVLPGLWVIPNGPILGQYFNDGDQYTFTTGDMAGKTLEMHYVLNTPTFFEVSNTW